MARCAPDRPWPRREFLSVALRLGGGTALLGATGAVGGCGIRLERDAPRPPFLPTPTPDPDTMPLLAELGRMRAAAAATTGSAAAAAWAPVLSGAVAALESACASLDPPVPVPPAGTGHGPGTGTPTPTSTATAPTATAGDTRTFLAACGAALDPVGRAALAAVSARGRPLLVAAHAQRAVPFLLLGGRLRRLPSVAVASEASGIRLVVAARAAVYGLEVAAAQAVEPARARIAAPLAALRAHRTGLEALVPAAPPPPLGYALPHPVTTPAQAARLAGTVLQRWADVVLAEAAAEVDLGESTAPASAAASPSAADPGDVAAAVTTVLWLVAQAEAARIRLGGRPRALTGLAAPATPSVPSPVTPAGPAPATPPATATPGTTGR